VKEKKEEMQLARKCFFSWASNVSAKDEFL